MNQADSGQKILQDMLAKLYADQAKGRAQTAQSYLLGADQTFLGEISESRYAHNSLLNQYGPYGSIYSPTSIFNPYSQYGSPYGRFSINNPYTNTPPKLILNGNYKGHVTKNHYLPDRIDADAFIATIRNNIRSLLQDGQLAANEEQARAARRESFVFAQDGTYLGSLETSPFAPQSIFNEFGEYGSRFSNESIWNTFGNYGGQFSDLSPFNQFAQRPPRLYVRGQFAGYLSKNAMLTPRVDPAGLKDWAMSNHL